jgi:hypothetical protein
VNKRTDKILLDGRSPQPGFRHEGFERKKTPPIHPGKGIISGTYQEIEAT